MRNILVLLHDSQLKRIATALRLWLGQSSIEKSENEQVSDGLDKMNVPESASSSLCQDITVE